MDDQAILAPIVRRHVGGMCGARGSRFACARVSLNRQSSDFASNVRVSFRWQSEDMFVQLEKNRFFELWWKGVDLCSSVRGCFSGVCW
jgi:hypothetical protein